MSSQLVAMGYWFEEPQNPVVMNKSLDGLNIPQNCSGICLPLLKEARLKIGKLCHFMK